ncbi:MAG: cyanophycin synthetase [Prochlorotrichaceae cyanobacterium]
MKILKIQTLRGPNYWSIRYHKLIVVRLDLEDLNDRYSDQIPGFHEGLIKVLPSLEEHFCSPGCRGGFLQRVKEGTLMGHIMEHVALELQGMVGMKVGFGRTRETADSGVYQVVFEYEDERAGRYAARAALRICRSIVDTGSYPEAELEQDLKELAEIWDEAPLGPSTESIVKEAEARNIPWMLVPTRSMIQFGYGVYQRRIQATQTDRTGILGVELACDKEGTKQILQEFGIPVPRGTVIYYFDELQEAIDSVGGYPIVIKPLDGNHGRGITLDIHTFAEAETAYDVAQEAAKTRGVIIERYYTGRDHRVLAVDGKVVAVAERVPAHVVGDGKSTIEELVDETNRDPRRGDGHDNVLTKIKIDRNTWKLLERKGYTLNTVLDKGEICYLRETANLSTGGIAIDRTDEIHPTNRWLAERVIKIIGLDIAGMDIVTDDISKPLSETDGVIVEVNAAPGFRMHVHPSVGTPRNVAAPVIDMIYPPGTPSRVPIVAITGTNGKTTTTRLTAHIFRQTEKIVGYTTTDGTYIGEYLVEAGDNTGPQSARTILNDPTVEFAVLESARGGILRSGLAFDQCDVGIVLNVAADHLGLGDINTIEQMAHLKAVVAETVHAKGYAVLNAEDELVAAMAERVRSKVAYFALNPDHPRIQAHLQAGGLVAVCEDGFITLRRGDWLERVVEAKDCPVTLAGMAPFMIANALAATLAAFTQGVTIEQIRAGLKTFRASADQTPGRMNLFNMGRFHALVDYAHNPAGYEALSKFVDNWQGKRIGVIGAPGDRRDEDFISLGRLSVNMFDRMVIKEDDDTRGRPRGDVANLIAKGIDEEMPQAHYQIILDETAAISDALDNAEDESLVVILPESVSRAIRLIRDRNPIEG